MKIFLKQFLLLGGFYFVVSLILNFSETKVASIIDNIIFLSTVVMLVILCFKKSYGFLTMFQNKYPKTSLYVTCLGGVSFIEILLFTIFGAIDGYKSAMAQYNGIDYESLYSRYTGYTIIFYAILLVLVLSWATYVNFIKPYIKRNYN